jgi:hypothetical protein
VAPGTVLRGERRDLVSIYFAEDNATSAPPAYVSSTRPGAWGLEDLTLYVTAFANSIVRFTPGTEGAFLRRSTIHFYTQYGNVTATTCHDINGDDHNKHVCGCHVLER